MVKLVTKDPTVMTEGHLISLGRDRGRWSVAIPHEAVQLLGKRTRYKVILKPLGSISPAKILGY